MRKHLMLILALAFVVGIACAAYAEVQNVKVSGDLTVLGISRDLDMKHGKEANTVGAGAANKHKTSNMASITRVRVDADLTDNVMATVRLLNERYWGKEDQNVSSSSKNSDIDLDLAYVTLKEFLYSPLTLTIGRQELNIGSGMILGDPDTNNAVTTASPFSATNGDPDLSARKAFDAVRATLNYDPLVIDAVYAKIDHNSGTTADLTIAHNNTELFGVDVNYALRKTTNVEGYLFEKRIGKNRNVGSGAPNKTDRTDVLGGRVVDTSIKDLMLSLEAAYQFGKFVDTVNNKVEPRRAWALEAYANYTFSKLKYTPSLAAMYSYFSGDNGSSSAAGGYRGNKAWDPMYENQKSGDIANALFNQSNAHIFGGIATMKPMDDIILKGEYYAYWWAKAFNEGQSILDVRGDSYTMTQRRFAGQEVDLTGIYNYTEDVSFSLMGGCFVPGSSFAKQTSSGVRQKKIASEVIGSMKVTF